MTFIRKCYHDYFWLTTRLPIKLALKSVQGKTLMNTDSVCSIAAGLKVRSWFEISLCESNFISYYKIFGQSVLCSLGELVCRPWKGQVFVIAKSKVWPIWVTWWRHIRPTLVTSSRSIDHATQSQVTDQYKRSTIRIVPQQSTRKHPKYKMQCKDRCR